MRLMYDSVTPGEIPTSPVTAWVAGYVDGAYANVDELRRRFPRTRVVTIATSAHSVADFLDVERGDATAAEAVGWVLWMRSLRRRPGVYTSRSNLGAVIAAFHARRVPVPFFWVADWTGRPHLVPGSIATQWASPGYGVHDGNYDVSVVGVGFPDEFQRKGGPSVTLDTQRLGSLLRQAGAICAEVIAIGNQLHLPPSIRGILAAAGGAILAVEHYVGDTSTGRPAS